MTITTLEFILIIPIALVLIFLLFRIASSAVFISYWKTKFWWQKELKKQKKEENENASRSQKGNEAGSSTKNSRLL
jgi:hypothetical protein